MRRLNRLHVQLACTAAILLGGTSLVIAQRLHAMQEWLTSNDGSVALARQPDIAWEPADGNSNGLHIDDKTTYQTMVGFGHALTGGSAQLLMKMSPAARSALLRELFGSGPNDLHTSYLRVTVGASDMNDHVYTYDDMPAGQTDPTLAHFSLVEDEHDVLPVLKEILAIQPDLRILATPWTAPAWMKTNGAVKGGELKPEYYGVFAAYWVKYLVAMQQHGVHIAALTPENEPENPDNTPSMVVTAPEEATLIGKYLGPAIAAAHLDTKIICFDHNADHPIYGETVLSDRLAGPYTDGTAFHLYYGEMSALSEVHDRLPQKQLYFTEQAIEPDEDRTKKSIAEPTARILIAAPNNWARNVLLWNLAADPQAGPHTSNGGCPGCFGAVTLDGDKITRLPAYYVAAHASKFVPPGSVRIGSDQGTTSLPHTAYRTQSGGHVLIVSNPSRDNSKLRILYQHRLAEVLLKAGEVATLVW